MFVVPAETTGSRRAARRRARLPAAGGGREGYVRYENVRVPADHMLGPRGGAFVVAQTRLGGGRIHHAMRTVGLVRRIFDMLCERAVSRYTQGDMLVQQAAGPGDGRRLVDGNRGVPAAHAADRVEDRPAQRLQGRSGRHLGGQGDDAEGASRRVERALQLHGSLGTTHEMPFVQYLVESFVLGLADGPTEVHKVTLARLLLRSTSRRPTSSRRSTCCGCGKLPKRSSPTNLQGFRTDPGEVFNCPHHVTARWPW